MRKLKQRDEVMEKKRRDAFFSQAFQMHQRVSTRAKRMRKALQDAIALNSAARLCPVALTLHERMLIQVVATELDLFHTKIGKRER